MLHEHKSPPLLFLSGESVHHPEPMGVSPQRQVIPFQRLRRDIAICGFGNPLIRLPYRLHR